MMSTSGSMPSGLSQPMSGAGRSSTTGSGSTTDVILGAVKRTMAQLQGGYSDCFSRIKKEEQATLKGTELEKLKKHTEEGLPSKFVLMKPVLKGDGSVNIERLKTMYPVSLHLHKFLQELCMYDMEEVFIRIPSKFELDSNNFWEPLVGAQVRSLFNVTQKPDLDSVHKTSSYMFDFGADYTVQSLIWSGHKFLASCDAELKAKILECVANYPELEQTGPVYLCLALELIQSSANAVLRTLTHALETVALRNIELENVWTFTTILQGIVDQFESKLTTTG